MKTDRKTAAFDATRRALEKTTALLHALHGALWLGLLRRGELNQIGTASFSNVSSHPSEQSELYNRSGLNGWEHEAVSEHFGGCRSFLVAGAGGGREVVALCGQDRLADGFECSRSLVEVASRILEEERLPGRVVFAECDEVPEAFAVYDAGIIGFGVYMHIVGRANRVRFLGDFARHLSPGAPLLLSFLGRGESRQDRYVAAVARAIQRLRRADVEVEVGDMLSDCFIHRFTEAEIVSELGEAGFEVVCVRAQPFPHAVAKWIGIDREAEYVR